MANDPIFNRPEFAQNQAQGFASGNERFLVANAFAAMRIEGRQNGPPVSPSDGDTWIVGDTPSGDWSTFTTDNVAISSGGGWLEIPKRAGMGGERRDLDGAWTYYSAEEATWVVGYGYWSTTEQRLRGRFPGDVDRFVKAFEFALANTGTAQQAHGITNPTLNEYLVLEGVAYDGTSATYALPWTDGTNVLELRMTTTNIEIISNFDASGWTARVRAIYSKD